MTTSPTNRRSVQPSWMHQSGRLHLQVRDQKREVQVLGVQAVPQPFRGDDRQKERRWPDDLHPGDNVGEWTLERLLGAGGQSRVFKATDAQQESVALKALRADFGDRARIEREVHLLERAKGLGLPELRAHSLGSEPWLAMQYIEGESLQEVVDRRGPLMAADGRSIALKLIVSLDTLHALPVFHRDVKPATWCSILIDSLGLLILASPVRLTQRLRRGDGWHLRIAAPEQLEGAEDRTLD